MGTQTTSPAPEEGGKRARGEEGETKGAQRSAPPEEEGRGETKGTKRRAAEDGLPDAKHARVQSREPTVDSKAIEKAQEELQARVREFEERLLESQQELADTRKELLIVKDSADMGSSMVSDLEEMRRQAKTALLAVRDVLVESGVPSKLKPDSAIPWYWDADSWTNQGTVPWDTEAKRAFTPAEGVAWLVTERNELREERDELKARIKKGMSALTGCS